MAFKKDYEKAKAEEELVGGDLEFLGKIEEKFDPLASYVNHLKGGSKRQKRE